MYCTVQVVETHASGSDSAVCLIRPVTAPIPLLFYMAASRTCVRLWLREMRATSSSKSTKKLRESFTERRSRSGGEEREGLQGSVTVSPSSAVCGWSEYRSEVNTWN